MSAHSHVWTLALPKEVEHWSLTTLREKLVKIGTKVVSHGRYVTFQLAEVAVPRELFRNILSLIDDLRPRPAPAEAEGYAYAIHLPTNAVLREQIAHFLRGSTMNRLRGVTGQSSAILSRIWKKLSGGWSPYLEDPTSVENLSHQMLRSSIPSITPMD